MPLHSVRFDEETENALAEVRASTGASTSEALKNGIVALRDGLARTKRRRPFSVYKEIDLGPGGYARAPARRAKQALREIVGRKRKA